MKIKFKNPPTDGDNGAPPPPGNQEPAPAAAVPESLQPSSGGSGLKLKLKANPTEAPSALGSAPAKTKRQYNRKPKVDGQATSARSRKRKADNEDGSTPSKKAKPGQHKITLQLSNTGARPVMSSKSGTISLKLNSAVPVSKGPSRLKMKYVGEKPRRPVGVGYDSEDEEAEDDPTISNQFIFRMVPGEDCDYLRRAIDEKKIGLAKSEGGADIELVFFDRDGRRGMITIRGRRYAFVLVDLPCVIEATKSWNRKDWLKSADIHQMLLVQGQVKNEDEARNMPVPPEVDKETYQYPHGLTPPMHWVRKRRFRKRISHRTIEAVEQEVERLLDLDAKAKAHGGRSTFEMVDLNAQDEEDEDEEEEAQQEEPGYEMEFDPQQGEQVYELEGNEEDIDEMEAAMQAAMEGGDDGEGEDADADADADGEVDVEMVDPSSADAATQQENGEASADGTPSAAAGTTDAEQDDGDDDDDDDDDEDEEETEEAAEARKQREEDQEALAEAEKELAAAKDVLAKTINMMLKKRQEAKVASLQRDVEVARAKLGID